VKRHLHFQASGLKRKVKLNLSILIRYFLLLLLLQEEEGQTVTLEEM